jgi:hypothetical protein
MGDGATSSNHRPGSTCIATITPTRILPGIVLLLPFYSTLLRPVDSNYIAANGQKVKCLGKAVMSLTVGNTVFGHEVTVGRVRNNLIGEDFII